MFNNRKTEIKQEIKRLLRCVIESLSLRNYVLPLILMNWYAPVTINTSLRYNEAHESYVAWLRFAQNKSKPEHP